ncbi:MAG: hypothetical protein QM763_24840 [Agriterribacter sp.]
MIDTIEFFYVKSGFGMVNVAIADVKFLGQIMASIVSNVEAKKYLTFCRWMPVFKKCKGINKYF